MKLSKFNLERPIGHETLVFNTLTTGFVKINTEEWTRIKNASCSLSLPDENPLVQSGIIVVDDDDETIRYKYRYMRHCFNADMPVFFIAPTMRCNFNCAYCFEAGNKNSGLMAEDTEDRLIKFIGAQGRKTIAIVWFGGEPLMGFKRILSICDKLEKEEIAFTSSMITNGSLLTASKIAQLDKLRLTHIQVSMDGTAEHQNKRRQFRGGKPTFDLVIRNVENTLKNTSCMITIQVATDRTNTDAFCKLRNYCTERLSEYMTSGRLQIGQNYVKDRTQFDSLNTCLSAHDILDREKVQLLEAGNIIDLPGLSMPCMYRKIASFAVDSDGNIYKCVEHLGAAQNKIGSLCSGTLSLRKLARTAFAADPFADSRCCNCNVFPICGGGCPLDRISTHEDGHSYCNRYKNTLKDLLPALYEAKYAKQ